MSAPGNAVKYTRGTWCWTPTRKELVLRLIEDGALTAEALCKTYNISAEEFESWRRAYARGGREALKVTDYKPEREKYAIPLIRAVGVRR